MKIENWRIIFAPLLILAFIYSCTDELIVEPPVNNPPETHLFLQFADTLHLPGETTSMQVLHWYGDDPDGEVIGFEHHWDYDSSWIFTTDVMDTFYVPITQPQDTFEFEIRAIDNGGLKDPTPDRLSFPIRNSPPLVSFPLDFVQRYSRNIYSSFSYFSIGWSSSDPDGDATITGFEWYLADSSFSAWDSIVTGVYYWNQATLDTMSWGHLDSLATLKTFGDLAPGSYRFFLRCRDVADAYSNVIFYPEKIPGAAWNVMPVQGNVLFVDDDRYASAIDSFIPISLANLYGQGGFSTWVTIDRISYYPRDIEETLKLFDKVIWHGGSYPHFREAGDAIANFVASGGRLLAFSTQRSAGDTTIYPFMPVDSIRTSDIGRSFQADKVDSCSIGEIPPGYPDSLSSSGPDPYPQYPIQDSYGISPGTPPALIPSPVDALYTLRSPYTGLMDTVAVRYPSFSSGPASIIYFSMQVYLCSAQLGGLLEFILEEEFQ
jgi:hypothetical protein